MKINNIYYLYVFLDPRKPGLFKYDDLEFDHEPFYTGISKQKNRFWAHFNESYKSNINSYKCNKIRKIKKETGNGPIILKIVENLSKDEACKLEVVYIKKIGRFDLGMGPLTNLTNGGDGIVGLSVEQKERTSKTVINLWKNKNYRDLQVKSHKEFCKNNPNVGLETGKKIKQAYIKNPELRKKAREREKIKWKNKNYKKKIHELNNTLTVKNNRSSGQKKRYKNQKEIDKSSKTWIIIYNDGHEEIIKNMYKFYEQDKQKQINITGKRYRRKWKYKRIDEKGLKNVTEETAQDILFSE